MISVPIQPSGKRHTRLRERGERGRMKRRMAAGLCFFLLASCGTSLGESITPGHETCGREHCYWETAMDISDEEAIWAMLMQPMITVRGDPRSQAPIHEQPNESSAVVGEVTCESQGVHLIEQLDGGWSRIECYSSSFKDSEAEAYNRLVVGYIRTDKLTERKVKTKYGLIVDKLTQRLYLFHDGRLLDTLAVSTGLADDEHPWNETRSGEFVLSSPTGAFPSDNLICNYGIRYNDGDLLHEVPHVVTSSGKNYGYTEPKLGSRASHGCIRVQRKRTPNGINMRWLWNELKDQMGTRLLIWEDWPGRQIAIPDVNLPLYYNAKGGEYYHAAATCYGVKDKYLPLTAFTYGALEDEPFRQLTACPYCYPPARLAIIADINAAYQREADE